MQTGPTRANAWTFLVGGDLLYRALAAVYWLVLARALSVHALGDVALATALSTPAIQVLDGGLTQYLIRVATPEGRLPRATRTPLRRRAVALVALPFAAAGFTYLLGSTEHRALIGLLVGASASFEGAAQAWLAGPRVRGNMRPDATFRAIYGTVSVATVGLAWAIGDLTGVLAAAATAGGAAAGAAACLRHLPPTPRFVDRVVSDLSARRRFLQTTLSTSAFLSTDVLIVGALLGSAKLAPYALATKVVATMAVLPVAMSRVSLSWAARGERGGMLPELRAASRIGLAISLAGLAAGPFAARVLFGTHYANEMLDPLRVLALALFVVGVKSPLLGRHLGAGDTSVVARAAILALGLALVLVPVGTLAIGTVGAAIAMLIAETSGAGPYVRRRREDGWRLRDLLPGPGATAVALAAAGAALVLPPFSPVVLPLAALASLAALGPRDLLNRARPPRKERSLEAVKP